MTTVTDSAEIWRGKSDARAQRLLSGPIYATLISLSLPTVALMTFQSVVQAVEGYLIGFLGSEALAGASLSLPLVMLMTTMSAGAFGGGVSSAVARAMGAGRTRDAGQIAATALGLSLICGIGFSTVMILFGRTVFEALGANSESIEAALSYSNILFLGAIPFWLFQAAASCLRGSGNTAYPAKVGALGGLLTLLVSPAMIFGFGPIPGLKLAGAAWAIVGYNIGSAALLLLALARGSGAFRMDWKFLWPDRRLAGEILRVAIPSSINTLTSNLTFLTLTALVAPFGTSALAGYGMSGRLEFLLIPIVFGIGSALVPLISANAGAGQWDRVRRATRAGLCLGALSGALIGLTAAIIPWAWIGLFSTDPDVVSTGESYLRIVGPLYAAFGGGLAMFFASQGLGKVLPSVFAGFSRLAIAGIGGSVVTRQWGFGLPSLFVVMSLGLLSYGLIMIIVRRRELWTFERNVEQRQPVSTAEPLFGSDL